MSVVGQTLATEDTNCPFGGVKLTDAVGDTHVCNGEPGAQGGLGEVGPQGTAGTSVTSQSLSQGNAFCPAGGTAFQSASGTTYACNAKLPDCYSGQILKWDHMAGWTCGQDVDTTGGDIFAVMAGSGLVGGGTSGDVTLGLAWAGSGTQWGTDNHPARADHGHAAPCPVGFTLLTESSNGSEKLCHYRFENPASLNWSQAAVACRQLGAHLCSGQEFAALCAQALFESADAWLGDLIGTGTGAVNALPATTFSCGSGGVQFSYRPLGDRLTSADCCLATREVR